MAILKLSATFDAETKRMYRYIIDKNDYGIEGAFYRDKEKVKEKFKKNRVLIKLKAKGQILEEDEEWKRRKKSKRFQRKNKSKRR